MTSPSSIADRAAGPAFDREIGEHVMGWTKDDGGWLLGDCHLSARLFHPTARCDDAFAVVRHMRKLDYRLMLRQEPDDRWEAVFYMPGWPDSKALLAVLHADSAPLAICRAALATITRPRGDPEPPRAWRCPSPEALKACLQNVEEV